MSAPIPIVWSPETRRHEPRHEVWVGVPTEGTEVPLRVDAILAGVSPGPHGGQRRSVDAEPHDDSVLRSVHGPEFLDHLATSSARWLGGPYAELVGQDRVVPYFFPTPALTQGMPPHEAAAVHARTGSFCYDTMTLVGPGTWEAAVAAVDCALTAVDLVLGGDQAAYALCRPPGHHATRDGYGGSCYLNNAAVAATALREGGHDKIAVIDVDAHHGNGTQAIFWDRGDVLYGSVHVDPGAGWFPHVFGYADERGSGDGAGATRNVPLAEGTGDGLWTDAVAGLADWAVGAGCTGMVVSLGVDAAVDDPESPLQVTKEGYRAAGEALAGGALPMVVVQEGGYHLTTLGALVDAFLQGVEG
jgi:acetoin utilization deacetylase AcuC-like enzyme